MGDRPPVGGAVWCDQHRRAECVHLSKRTKQRCHQQAVSGTDTCWSHGGKTLAALRAEGRVRLELAAFGLGEPGAAEVDPGDALLRLLAMAVERVARTSGLLGEEFRAAAERGRAEAQNDAGGSADAPGGGRVGPPGAEALVGYRYVLDKDGHRVAVAEDTRGLAAYEERWVDRAGRLAKDAVLTGVVAKQDARQERLGALFAELVRAALRDLGAPVEEDRVMRVVAQRMRALGGGGT
jgi:hypothetical protein